MNTSGTASASIDKSLHQWVESHISSTINQPSPWQEVLENHKNDKDKLILSIETLTSSNIKAMDFSLSVAKLLFERLSANPKEEEALFLLIQVLLYLSHYWESHATINKDDIATKNKALITKIKALFKKHKMEALLSLFFQEKTHTFTPKIVKVLTELLDPAVTPNITNKDKLLTLFSIDDSFSDNTIKTWNTAIKTTYISKRISQVCGGSKYFGLCQRISDKHSGNVLYSFPRSDNPTIFSGNSNLISGSANILTVQLFENFDLLIKLKKGSFTDHRVNKHVAFNTAFAIDEYLTLVPSLLEDLNTLPYKQHTPRLFIEHTTDNNQFTPQVIDQLTFLNPSLAKQCIVSPSMANTTMIEKVRYLNAPQKIWEKKEMEGIIDAVILSGYNINILDLHEAFADSKVIQLKKNEILFEENTQPKFTYISLDNELKGSSKSDKEIFSVQPFIPIGHIGILQDDVREATIKARDETKILMIPSDLFLSYWISDR